MKIKMTESNHKNKRLTEGMSRSEEILTDLSDLWDETLYDMVLEVLERARE